MISGNSKEIGLENNPNATNTNVSNTENLPKSNNNTEMSSNIINNP